MNQPAYQRRFVAQAEAAPDAFDAYCRQRLGHPAATVHQMLAIHRHLVDGKKVTPAQVRQLQAAHPGEAHLIPGIAQKLNEGVAPGDRPARYLALIAGDEAGIRGDFTSTGETFRELNQFVESYHRESAAEQINARREANVDPDIKARVIERPKDDPMSTRRLIESAMDRGAEGVRDLAEAVDRGDPDATRVLAGHMADRAERAAEALEKPEASTRDTVAAAFEWHAVENMAQDQGLVAQEQA